MALLPFPASGYLPSLATGPSPSSEPAPTHFSDCSSLVTAPSDHSRERLSVFKHSGKWVGLTQIVPANFPPELRNLNHIMKSLVMWGPIVPDSGG